MGKKSTSLIGVITGDVINSRTVITKKWLSALKNTLAYQGDTPKTWEIYRGDSFQVEVKHPEETFQMAMRIKAAIKKSKNLDVRMAIGIGTKDYSAKNITESNGSAFINSGEKLESLKMLKQSLAIKTPWTDLDDHINTVLRLALIAMDNWTTGAAELVSLLMDNESEIQQKLAGKLKITQSSFSERKKRAYYDEIAGFNKLYRKLIQERLS